MDSRAALMLFFIEDFPHIDITLFEYIIDIVGACYYPREFSEMRYV